MSEDPESDVGKVPMRRSGAGAEASSEVDIAVLTVLPSELAAARDALGIGEGAREKGPDGTIVWRGSVRSTLLGRSYRVALTCIGQAGNPGAAAAVSGVIAKHRPRAVMLVGIAAGLRGKVRIGEVVLSDRVVAYEPAALVSSADGTASEERRPEIDRTAYAMSQDIVSYRPDLSRIEAIFSRIGGRFPGGASEAIPEELRAHVAGSVAVHAGTVASGEKLLRHPGKLLAIREQIHGKVEVGEMEAAGVVEACRRGNVPWLIVRGISDFGDDRKEDRFQDLAARAAASVLADFLAHGLDIGDAVDPGLRKPTPSYPDEKTRKLSEELDEARERQKKLRDRRADTSSVDREIQSLRREIREGGQLRAGDSLGDGRYLLLDQIGRGGFSIVWKAHDGEDGMDVAIKVLHTELAGDSVRRDRFFRGARRMMDLSGEGVVRVLDPHGEDGGYHYFVMELIEGADLRRAVLEKRLPAGAIIPVILRVGEALARAHERGLVHRDIKPANILLDLSGAPWLTDFDLVGGAADSTGGTRTDAALGTFGYAAPELLLNAPRAGPRADVYGLGMTTVFGLHGAELRALFVHGARKIIEELECTATIKAVLFRAVAIEESERFADAGDFCRALRKAWEVDTSVAAEVASQEEERAAETVRTRTRRAEGEGRRAEDRAVEQIVNGALEEVSHERAGQRGEGGSLDPDRIVSEALEEARAGGAEALGEAGRHRAGVVQSPSPWIASRRSKSNLPRAPWWRGWRGVVVGSLAACGVAIAVKVIRDELRGDSSPLLSASGSSLEPIGSALSTAASALITPVPAPSPQGGGLNKSVMDAVLNVAAAGAMLCNGYGRSGSASVLVTFAPAGHVTSARVDNPPFSGTATGECIAKSFRVEMVPAFSGSPVTTRKTVVIR